VIDGEWLIFLLLYCFALLIVALFRDAMIDCWCLIIDFANVRICFWSLALSR